LKTAFTKYLLQFHQQNDKNVNITEFASDKLV